MKHPNVERQPSGDQGRPLSSRPPSSSRRDPQKPNTSRPSSGTADVDVLSQLTSLRRQLKNEEIKVQQQLSENKVWWGKIVTNDYLSYVCLYPNMSRSQSLTREFGKHNGNVSKDVLNNNSIFTRRQRRP